MLRPPDLPVLADENPARLKLGSCSLGRLVYGDVVSSGRKIITDGSIESWHMSEANSIGIQLWHVPNTSHTESTEAAALGYLKETAMIMPPIDVAVLIRDVNASNEAVEDQCLRARQAADIATRSACTADQSAAAAVRAEVAHQTIQAERPRRHAPLPRQMVMALMTVILDGVACYFAAQALDGSQDATLVWTGLFLAVLAGGEIALDFYRDRNVRTWRSLVILIGFFVTLLGTLRFWFLATIGTGGLVPAIAGACLFTVATAGFLSLGYRALRAAETPQAWRARRQARRARQAARAAREIADRDAADRDRLIDAYLSHVRRKVQKTCPAEEQLATESAVRDHLSGRCLGERSPVAGADPAHDGTSCHCDKRLGMPAHASQSAARHTYARAARR
jgi:hypothetical protein